MYNKKNIIIYIMISIILSFVMQNMIASNTSSIYKKLNFTTIDSKMDILNYDVIDNTFISKSDDPQLLFSNVNTNASAIKIEFQEPIQEDISIQVYYAKSEETLSEKKSARINLKKGKSEAVLEIPFNFYTTIRVDIGTKENISFDLDSINICNEKISTFIRIINKTFFITACSIFIILILLNKYKLVLFNKENRVLEYLFILFCFIMFTLWAIVQPFDSCPDEKMRYDVIKYVFDNNKLPHGGEESLLSPIWGFSYAFLPYLSGLISVLFMKIISFFTMNDQILVIVARMASVCFGTITVYYVIKLSNKLFKNIYKWLFIILVSCLPQFVFLSSYINNDILALMSVVMMIYYWLEGHENKWNNKSSIGLALSVAICILSYYNAYPFVLFSIIFFIWSNINNKEDKNIIIKKFMTISIIVFILSGWWFIRNFILYNGDFLGMKTMTEYSNIYAQEDIKPINHLTPLKQNYPIIFTLINQGWIKNTYKSFLGVFGYMNIYMNNWMYVFYTIIILLGILFFGYSLLKKKIEKKYIKITYLYTFISSIIIILLSFYRSYTVDFQPQGRYVIECLIPLSIFITEGFICMVDISENRLKNILKISIIAIMLIFIFISMMCLFTIIIPEYR